MVAKIFPNLSRGKDIVHVTAKEVSNSPGIYKMIGGEGEILYIGKAKNLPNRIAQYANFDAMPNRLKRMVSFLDKIEVLLTKTEQEALLLESQLIKKVKPRYNILQKDDKSFPYIALDRQNDFPRLYKYRGTKNSNLTLYGPFIDSGRLMGTMKEMQKLFLLRTCSDAYFKSRKRPCLLYDIKRCSGPCVSKISQEEYQDAAKNFSLFVNGKSKTLYQKLLKDMNGYSLSMQYEQAAIIRDQLKCLNGIQSNNVSGFMLDHKDVDVFVLYHHREYKKSCFYVCSFKNGQNLGTHEEYFDNFPKQSDQELLQSYVFAFYQKREVPEAIFSNVVLDELIHLDPLRKIGVRFLKKESSSIMEFVFRNAEEAYERYIREYVKNRDLLKELSDILGNDYVPEKIEIYDNSHNFGESSYGCVVVFGVEGFLKNEYRKYKISNDKNDDYMMLSEVLRKRFAKKNPSDFPELILIDGGKGHLNVAYETLRKLELNIPMLAISKGKQRNASREVFHQIGKDPFILNKTSDMLLFMQKMRDEAHRFAITTHKKSMAKKTTFSILENIPGVGKERKKALLTHFNSFAELKLASVVDIANVSGISMSLAVIIFDYIRENVAE